MITIISYLILLYFVLINLSYLLLFIVSYFGIVDYRKKMKLNNYLMIYQSKLTPPISLLVPAYNEENTILKNINAFLSDFNYPEYEIVVINDGSNDNTLSLVIEEFKCEIDNFPFKKTLETKPIKNIYRSMLYPKLVLIDKVNGGKADALNAGINVSKYPYFGSIDADTILERDSYLKVIIPIVNDPKKVIASGGIVGVINGCEVNENKIQKIKYPKHLLAKFQVVEYLRAFLFGRYAWTLINALPLISGAFGLFKKDAVLQVGGYSSKKTSKSTVGEDMELVIRLHRYFLEKKADYEICFVPDPLSWTQVPEDLITLKNQRARWHRGLMETMSTNRDMIFNKKYKSIGLLSMPYYFIFEYLSPVIELTGYILLPIFFMLNMISIKILVYFYILAILIGVLISLFAVFMEIMTFRRYIKISDTLQMICFGILENIGYRQLTLFFRLIGFFQYFKRKEIWGEMKRKQL